MLNNRNTWLVVLIFVLSNIARAQIKSEVKDSLMRNIEGMLSNDWFLQETKTGFKVYFCRSCQNAYFDQKTDGDHPFGKERNDFFSIDKLDSVSYYGTVSQRAMPFSDSVRDRFKREKYAATDIMSFEIIFEKSWTKIRYDSIFQKNELLKAEILKQPLYKESNRIFSDYRFWLPDKYLKNRTQKFDFYFQRLPYASVNLDYSIFIVQDKPSFFCEPLYVDKNDPKYYENKASFLYEERKKALRIIALALGIKDFKIVS